MREKRKQEEDDGDLDDIPLFLSIMYNTMFHASYQGLPTQLRAWKESVSLDKTTTVRNV